MIFFTLLLHEEFFSHWSSTVVLHEGFAIGFAEGNYFSHWFHTRVLQPHLQEDFCTTVLHGGLEGLLAPVLFRGVLHEGHFLHEGGGVCMRAVFARGPFLHEDSGVFFTRFFFFCTRAVGFFA